jgi:hypothetical protein
MQALLRLYEGPIKALFRLYQALLRLYSKNRPRIDELDPFAPTRKWLDADEARAQLPNKVIEP